MWGPIWYACWAIWTDSDEFKHSHNLNSSAWSIVVIHSRNYMKPLMSTFDHFDVTSSHPHIAKNSCDSDSFLISFQYLDWCCRAIPMGRVGEVEEVARLVAFLASTEANYLNGAKLYPQVGVIRYHWFYVLCLLYLSND